MAFLAEGICKIPPAHAKMYRPQQNYFGYEITENNIKYLQNTKCRESLHKSRVWLLSLLPDRSKTDQEIREFSYDSRPFWFYNSIIPKELFVLFFNKVESRLGINSGLSFQAVDEKGWTAIHLDKFWGGVQSRLGFFTCLLRGMALYIVDKLKKDCEKNIENWIDWVLFNSEYINETPMANYKFMTGKTFVYDFSLTADWYANMTSKITAETNLLDPRKFTHDEYVNIVNKYAFIFKALRPSLTGENALYVAEKYAALNAIR